MIKNLYGAISGIAMEKTVNGKILKGVGGLYDVMTEDGTVISCGLRGVFRHEGIKACVGDNVRILYETENSPVVDEILPRKNCLIRPPLANIDILFIVLAAAKPMPILQTADKLISIAEYEHIEPVVIISKSDLDCEYSEKLSAIYRKCGIDSYTVSSVNSNGLKDLALFIQKKMSDGNGGKCAAFAGASGVGKSSLMNSLFPKLSLDVGEISRKTERGRHTTRSVSLYPYAALTDASEKTDGFIADTPGFSLLDFLKFDFYTKEDLPYTFREFRDYIGKCRYTKCTHTKEQGCAVIEAVERGDIPKERHESFCSIYDDIKDKRPWDKHR